jgi:hypothetical protein
MSGQNPIYRFSPFTLLAWIGRQGSRAVAALVFIGIAIPPIGMLLRPFVTAAIFLLLTISFSRVDMGALRHHLRRPGIVLAATGWTSVGVPLLFGIISHLFDLNLTAPGLNLGLMLQGFASPMMAVPALATLMGLDATLALITLVLSTALVPMTAPLFTAMFLGRVQAISPLVIGLKLLSMLTGSLLLAAIIRHFMGAAAIRRHGDAINGFNIVIMLIFVAAVMCDVAGDILTDPMGVAAAGLLAFGVFFALLFSTMVLFRKAGGIPALTLGLVVSQRNLGLMLAATGGTLPGSVWLYFALCQFPIYLSPLLLRPLVKARCGSGV